ncbi:hypothetical protein [Aeromonas popoffii]|uniref:hypothetical protein n=1 Tax=Aeromonas popoffii TaxID=70856 RepID=UPI0030D5DDEA
MSQVLSGGLVSAAEVSVFYEAQLVYRWRQDGFAVATGNETGSLQTGGIACGS